MKSAPSEFAEHALDFADCGFIALIECPLLNAFPADEAGGNEDVEMLAGGRLAHLQLAGNEEAADTVLYKIPIHLRREVFLRGCLSQSRICSLQSLASARKVPSDSI